MGITFLVMSFAEMGVFKTVGVSSAIGIGVAYLADVTLLPAIWCSRARAAGSNRGAS